MNENANWTRSRADAKPKGSGKSRVRSASAPESDSIVADQTRTIARLKERRIKDLERLGELTQARDLLEARLALQQTKTAEALAKVKEKEKALAQIDQRIGGARLLDSSTTERDQGEGRRSSPLGALGGRAELLWRQWTLHAARRARSAGKLVEAQILLDAVLLSRESAGVWTELAHVLRERSLFDSAEAAYDRALELDQKNAENLFLAGYCAEMGGRKEQASRRYEEALAKDPKLAERYDHLRDYNSRLFD